MPYDHSLTQQAQEVMNTSILSRIQKINENEMNALYAKSRPDYAALRRFLLDTSTLTSPGFVLRRYIQTKFPHFLTDAQGNLLRPGVDYTDLTRNANVPWEKDGSTAIVDQVAKKLAHICAQNHKQNPDYPNLTKTTWHNYLTDSQPQADRILMIAVTLQMDVETTKEYCLACGYDGYSARNPLDMICYYCQQWPEQYDWPKVLELFRRFQQQVRFQTAASSAPPAEAPAGQTARLYRRFSDLFNASLPADQQDQALISMMAGHADQFLSYRWSARGDSRSNVWEDARECARKTTRKNARADAYPGLQRAGYFSRTNRLYYMRLLQYLAALYPQVEHDAVPESAYRSLYPNRTKDADDPAPRGYVSLDHILAHVARAKKSQAEVQENLDIYIRGITYPLKQHAGLLDLEDLMDAMYSPADWNFGLWEEEGELAGYKPKPTKSKKNIPPTKGDYVFCRDYITRARAILHIKYSKNNALINPAVCRKDILLLGYFLLRGLQSLCNPPVQEWPAAIRELLSGGHLFTDTFPSLAPQSEQQLADLLRPFDSTMQQILSQLRPESSAQAYDIQAVLHHCLDLLLDQFGFLPLYLPAVFDRFVRLSLMMDNQDSPLPLLLLTPFKAPYHEA